LTSHDESLGLWVSSEDPYARADRRTLADSVPIRIEYSINAFTEG
jgi:hypothetical protein